MAGRRAGRRHRSRAHSWRVVGIEQHPAQPCADCAQRRWHPCRDHQGLYGSYPGLGCSRCSGLVVSDRCASRRRRRVCTALVFRDRRCNRAGDNSVTHARDLGLADRRAGMDRTQAIVYLFLAALAFVLDSVQSCVPSNRLARDGDCGGSGVLVEFPRLERQSLRCLQDHKQQSEFRSEKNFETRLLYARTETGIGSAGIPMLLLRSGRGRRRDVRGLSCSLLACARSGSLPQLRAACVCRQLFRFRGQSGSGRLFHAGTHFCHQWRTSRLHWSRD